MAAILFFNKIAIKVFLSHVFVFRMICMIIYYNPTEFYVSIHKWTTYAFLWLTLAAILDFANYVQTSGQSGCVPFLNDSAYKNT